MTPAQARNLLALIADLYAVASTPEAKPADEVSEANGFHEVQLVTEPAVT